MFCQQIFWKICEPGWSSILKKRHVSLFGFRRILPFFFSSNSLSHESLVTYFGSKRSTRHFKLDRLSEWEQDEFEREMEYMNKNGNPSQKKKND